MTCLWGLHTLASGPATGRFRTEGQRKPREVMDFLVRVMRYLFWVLVLSWSMWLLKKALGWVLRRTLGPGTQAAGGFAAAGTGAGSYGPAGNAMEQNGLPARKLVRDPVCGVYLAEVLAVPLREGGELVHFCSTACRDKYATQVQRRAAAG